MKKFTYIFFLAAALLLTGCASRENRVSHYNNINLVSVPSTVQESQATEFPESEGEPAELSQEALGETEAAAEPAESEEVLPEQTQATFDDAAEQPLLETPEAAVEDTYEGTCETDEELDTFYIDEYAAYSLTKRERAFTRDTIFVGDSICLGFSRYNVVSDSNVFARGSVAARNFFDFSQYIGDEEVDYLTVLERKQPKYVLLSMGMNDINLTNEDTYCKNYHKIIETTLEHSDAVVFVAAITPINSEFSTNYRIDCFNVKLEEYLSENFPERVCFVDFAKHMKDADGNLKDCFNGGDGIHLGPYAYYVALWEMNRTMNAEGITG